MRSVFNTPPTPRLLRNRASAGLPPEPRAFASRASLWFALVAIVVICAPAISFAQGAAARSQTHWATEKSFQKSRNRPFTISWQAAPIRARTNELARQQGISIFLDRRINPRTPIDLTASNVTMEQLLLKLCQQQGLGFCRIGDSFYLGPKQSAKRLLIRTGKTSKTNSRIKTALSRKATFDWPELATPKEALSALAAEAHLELENDDLLPHDLMAAISTPALTLDQRLSLLLIQFGLDYEIKRNSRTLVLRRLSEMPANATVRFSEVDLSLSQYQKIKAKANASRMKRSKRSVTVTGPVDELVMVRDFIVKSVSPTIPENGDKQFSLKVTSRRSAILSAIGKQLQMPVDTSLADPDALAEVVNLSVANVSLQELLDQITANSNATCVVTDGKIVVRQK